MKNDGHYSIHSIALGIERIVRDNGGSYTHNEIVNGKFAEAMRYALECKCNMQINESVQPLYGKLKPYIGMTMREIDPDIIEDLVIEFYNCMDYSNWIRH